MKNPFSKLLQWQKGKRGYTLLFSVIVATLVLSVAAFILSISRKQFILSSSARDSMYAFYAADSGIECAVLQYNKSPSTFATTSIWNNSIPSVECGGTFWTAHQTGPGYPSTSPYYDAVAATPLAATTSYVMRIAQTQACAWIKVGYHSDNTGTTTYMIESRGYNIGWNQTNQDCSNYGPRKVERALRLIYE